MPPVTKGICKKRDAVTEEFIRQRPKQGGTGANGPLDKAIHIRDVQVNKNRSAPNRDRTEGTEVGVLIGEHDVPSPNLDFRVPDLAALILQSENLPGCERLCVKFDRLRGTPYDQVGAHGLVFVGNGLDGHAERLT